MQSHGIVMHVAADKVVWAGPAGPAAVLISGSLGAKITSYFRCLWVVVPVSRGFVGMISLLQGLCCKGSVTWHLEGHSLE